MALRMISCPCDEQFETDIPETFHFPEDPSLLSRFRRGDFMIVSCPKCKVEIEIPFPFTCTGISRLQGVNPGFDSIRFLPESDRNAFLSGKIGIQEDRLVIGREEMQEKMAVLQEGLDDRLVELIKFLLLEKIGREKMRGEMEEDIRISFSGRDESGSLEFQVSGIRKGELARIRTPQTLYEKAGEDVSERLKETPFREILNGPYVSINKIDLEV